MAQFVIYLSPAKGRYLTPHENKRFQYFVLTDDGRKVRLGAVARKAKLVYSTLAKAVRDAELTTGTHDISVLAKIIDRVRRGARLQHSPHTAVCPTCRGVGRVWTKNIGKIPVPAESTVPEDSSNEGQS